MFLSRFHLELHACSLSGGGREATGGYRLYTTMCFQGEPWLVCSLTEFLLSLFKLKLDKNILYIYNLTIATHLILQVPELQKGHLDIEMVAPYTHHHSSDVLRRLRSLRHSRAAWKDAGPTSVHPCAPTPLEDPSAAVKQEPRKSWCEHLKPSKKWMGWGKCFVDLNNPYWRFPKMGVSPNHQFYLYN